MLSNFFGNTLVCEDCKASMPIVSSYAGEIHRHAVNLRSTLAKVAIELLESLIHLLRHFAA